MRLLVVLVAMLGLSSGGLAEAPKVAWGAPEGGLAIGLSLSGTELDYGQSLVITLQFKNTTDHPIRLIDLDTSYHVALRVGHELGLYYQPVDGGRVLGLAFQVKVAQGQGVDEIKAGDVRTLSFKGEQLRPGLIYFEQGKNAEAKILGASGWYSLASWPPLPGRYRLWATYGVADHDGKAAGAGLWASHISSEKVELTARPYAFLKDIADNPKLADEAFNELALKATAGQREAVEKLMALGDRRSILVLLGATRGGQGITPEALRWLGGKFGETIAPDLLRASHAQSSQVSDAAAHELGKLGTAGIIESARQEAAGGLWVPQDGFIRGLGESKTEASLAALVELAGRDSLPAVIALAQRPEEAVPKALSGVMLNGREPAASEAARRLASRGSVEGVRWLTQHWDWLNAAAMMAAPIEWPKPGEGMIGQDKALNLAQQAVPMEKPACRFFEGRWYIVCAYGHPQVRGRFAYVILDPATGKVLAQDDHRVLR